MVFFSSCARKKRMNSSHWVPLSRRIWRCGTDFSSRASQNLLPHPTPKVAQQKAFKGWKRTFPCHSVSAQICSWSCSLRATVPYLFCVKIVQFIKCTRLLTVPVPGFQGSSCWTSRGAGGGQALAAGWVQSHPSFLLPQLLPATPHRCAHTFAPSLALTHSLLSGLTSTFFLERMCSSEVHDCDVWLFINTSMLNSFPVCKGTFPNSATRYYILYSGWMFCLDGFCSGSSSFLQSTTKRLLLQFHLDAELGENCSALH